MLEHTVSAIDTDAPEPFYPLTETHPAPHVLGSVHLASGGFALLSQGQTQNSLVVSLYGVDGSLAGFPITIAGGPGAKITALSTGGFAVGWFETPDSFSVLAKVQAFNGAGMAAGAAFTFSQSNNKFSAGITGFGLTGTSTGDIALSWSVGSSYSFSASDVYAEIVSPTGTVVHAPAFFHSSDYVQVEDIDALADGRFVLSYTEQAPGGNSFASTVLSTFNPANDSFTPGIVNIAPATGYRVLHINTTLLTSGNLLVSWSEYAPATNGYAFRGEIVTPTGTLVKASFDKVLPVNGGLGTAVALPDGGFIIAYASGTGSNNGIATQVFDAAGNAVNAETILSNPNQSAPSSPVLATFGNGDVALAYNYAASVSASDSTLKLLYPATSGTTGDDHLVGTADADILLGLGGNDLIEGNAGNDIIFGGSGDDQLYGGDGNDQLFGDSGNDLLDGGSGVNQLDGGAGDDVLNAADASGSTLVGGLGNDRLTANAGQYLLYGDSPADTGSGNDDTITLINGLTGSAAYGGAGNDILNLSGTGQITADGGTGDDQITIAGFSQGTISLGDGNDLLRLPAGSFTIDLGRGQDTIELTSTGAGFMTLIGFNAGSLGDRLDLSVFGSDPVGSGSLTLTQHGPDTYIDQAASGLRIVLQNVLVANLSAYNLGVPNTAYAPVDQILQGSFPNDPTANIFDELVGADGNDTLFGYGGNDRLFGADGNDLLIGGLGADLMVGGNGNDTYEVDNNGDVVTELADQGTDLVRASIDYALTANVENLDMSGGRQVYGTGNDLDNVITGNAANNVLSGGLGADRLTGGAGADTFRDTLAGHAGDTVTDFAFGDRLVFSDATPGSFTYSLSGSTLTYAGGSMTLSNLSAGRLVASAAVGGGVQLVLAAPVSTAPIFSPPGAVVVANFNPANGWTNQDQFPRHVADMNGDGYADIVGFGIAGVFVSNGGAGGSFAAPRLVLAQFNAANGWTNDSQYHRALGDLNGDGRSDIIGFGIAGTYTSTIRADGSFGNVTFALDSFGANQGWTSQDGTARIVGDVNGDGKADIVGFGNAGTWVGLGNGDGTFQSVRFGLAGFGINQGWTSDNIFHRELADVNGDGRADIVGFGIAGTYVALSNGDGSFGEVKLALGTFGTQQGWSSQDGFTRLVADVNGDHIADIVGFTYGGALVAIGNGDGTFQPLISGVAGFGRDQGWTSDATYHREIADVNHDGFADIVGFGSAGVYVGTNLGFTY